MTAASDRPLCRWCAKPLAKRTETIRVRKEPFIDHYISKRVDFRLESRGGYIEERVEVPRQKNTLYDTVLRSKADCQRHTNGEVVSLKYNDDRTVSAFNTWDGSTYEGVAGFFCSTTCAVAMGKAAAESGKGSFNYAAAIAKRADAKPVEIPRAPFPKIRGASQ